MSYIKNKTSEKELINWLKLNHMNLLKIGLPDEILSDRHRWNYLLDHGYDIDSGWDFEQLVIAETKVFLTLVGEQFPLDRWAYMEDLRRTVSGV
ncbi:MAG: hypothetical protein OIF51_19205 [Cellvibrionaceae bacterium]|nr:hypothetical protein [Cellvibrionaceae bacterium]